ncbi:siderophore-interacting protein [Ramlibacter sp. GTP1]|uniref:Siderophore-interacting protein n=2 Tax=Ramlibacter albus TaxID=2079448 RepID=A0A923MA08_9BURK|nr:siderophore-interacting protein [Ramlibacter albus]
MLTPNVRSITFGGDALHDFVSASFDDHVKVFIPDEGQEPIRRDYTPRHFDRDARELTIEFYLHADGPASRWAAAATVGDEIAVGGPRGSFIVPLDYDRHVLVGDLSALPAIARRLEELPITAVGTAILQAAPRDRRALVAPSQLEIAWVSTPAECLSAVKQLRLASDEDTFVWCAGENRQVAEWRRLFVDEKGLSRHAIRASAYWRSGEASHHETL